MRDKLALLAPELGTEKREIDRDLTEKAQERMKKQHDKGRQLKVPELNPGDMIRVKGPDGKFSDYIAVRSVGERTVTTEDDKKWALDRVSTRIISRETDNFRGGCNSRDIIISNYYIIQF